MAARKASVGGNNNGTLSIKSQRYQTPIPDVIPNAISTQFERTADIYLDQIVEGQVDKIGGATAGPVLMKGLGIAN